MDLRNSHEIDKVFKAWQWGECLDYLNNIIYHSENIILVSGLPSTGKTTLKQEIICALPQKCKVFSLDADPRLNPITLIRQITVGFEIAWNGDPLNGWEDLSLAINTQQEYNWILLIDDAEKLPWEVLTTLLELYLNVRVSRRFSLILFADPNLLKAINQSELKEFFAGKCQVMQLESLSLAEMKKFLGEDLKFNFDRQTLKKIYTASEGMIGKAKQLAIAEHNIKNQVTYMNKYFLLSKVNPTMMRVLGCISLLCLAFFGFKIIKAHNIQNFELPMQQTVLATAATELGNKLDPTKADLAKIETQKISTNNPELNQEIIPNLTPADSQNPNISGTLEALSTKLQGQINTNLQAQVDQLQTEIHQLKTLHTQLQHKLNELASNSIHPQSTEQTVAKERIKNNFLNKTKTLDLAQRSKTFSALAEQKYVLQLLASKNQATIQNVLTKYPEISRKVQTFSGKFQPAEDLWFILVYGTYANPEAALKDLKNLPKDLQKLKPLVRHSASLNKFVNHKKL